METITIAGGCFWCFEAILRRLKGVESVLSGYTGGAKPNPTYEEVSSGRTGHAEGVQVTFDPAVLPLDTLLEVFFKLHDPTTLNRQGPDVGTQYRSAIFYNDEKQKETAEHVKQKIDASRIYSQPVVTEITPFDAFYPAEDYHLDFYERNQTYPYCQVMIDPKIKKLYKDFGELAV